jgi:hypothetical protein
MEKYVRNQNRIVRNELENQSVDHQFKQCLEATRRWVVAGRGRDRGEVQPAWRNVRQVTQTSKVSVEEIIETIYRPTSEEALVFVGPEFWFGWHNNSHPFSPTCGPSSNNSLDAISVIPFAHLRTGFRKENHYNSSENHKSHSNSKKLRFS